MRLSKLVQILLVSQVFVAAALASTRNLSANPSDISSNSQLTEDTELASELEEVLGEENVKEMVQMVLTDQMYLDHKMQQRKRQYKRDIYSSSSQSSTIGTTTSRTTARHSKPTITAKQKPVKFTAIPKNGVTYTKITNKNRVGSSGTRVTTKIPAKNPTKLPGPGDTKVKVSYGWKNSCFYVVFTFKILGDLESQSTEDFDDFVKSFRLFNYRSIKCFITSNHKFKFKFKANWTWVLFEILLQYLNEDLHRSNKGFSFFWYFKIKHLICLYNLLYSFRILLSERFQFKKIFSVCLLQKVLRYRNINIGSKIKVVYYHNT